MFLALAAIAISGVPPVILLLETDNATLAAILASLMLFAGWRLIELTTDLHEATRDDDTHGKGEG